LTEAITAVGKQTSWQCRIWRSNPMT